MRRRLMTVATSLTLLALPACGPVTNPSADDLDQSAAAAGTRSPRPPAPEPAPEPAPAPGEDPASPLALPSTPYAYASIALPAHFRTDFVQAQDNTPPGNPVTNDGATLGRVLFYDKNLSLNRAVACASCHRQDRGFSDSAQFSTGFDGGLTGRNSMPLSNARFYRSGRFFWDERAATLEAQVLMPIQNAVEMGLTLTQLVERVAGQSYYPSLFNRAFGTPQVTGERISRALAQFVRSIVSYRSRFDEGLAATGSLDAPFPALTPEENRGKALFLRQAGCATCHLVNPPPPPGAPPPAGPNGAVFFVNVATNNGLTTDLTADPGVGGVTGRPGDVGRFKSPELRNVALTAPYMHDGSIATLAEVVEHYNNGVQPHQNLDPRLRVPGTATPRRLNLSPADRAALVAFLGTLTDQALLTDPMYADPFKAP